MSELESERATFRFAYRAFCGAFGAVLPTALFGSLILWQALPTDSPGHTILYIYSASFWSIVACTGPHAREAREKFEKKKGLDKD